MKPTLETGLSCERWTAVVQSSCLARSGDCARIVSRPDGRALFFIADVAGHDARATGFATELDARVSYLASWASPGELLGELNAAVEASWPFDVFVSAVCFLLDPATGQGTIAAAGQVAPVIRSASCCREVEMHTGPALGLIAEQRYPERRFVLEAGDVLVAVTDGITDPFATASDLLGLGALARILDAGPTAPAAVCASLMSATRGFGLRDDATVLAIAPALSGPATSALAGRAAASLAA
jgi:sigma-B regulation protein RsbU (phosphoserine phosphatase)